MFFSGPTRPKTVVFCTRQWWVTLWRPFVSMSSQDTIVFGVRWRMMFMTWKISIKSHSWMHFILVCLHSLPLSAKISSPRPPFWMRFFAISAPEWQLQLAITKFFISPECEFYVNLSGENIVFFCFLDHHDLFCSALMSASIVDYYS